MSPIGPTQVAIQFDQPRELTPHSCGMCDPHPATRTWLFEYGRRAAEEANRTDLVANSFLHVSYMTGAAEAVRSAELVCAAIGSDPRGRTTALFDSRRAWSYAVNGDRDQAARALESARNAVDADDDSAPPWCSWVDHTEIDIMTGRVWSVLGGPALPSNR